MSLSDLLRYNQRCKLCGIKKNSGSNHHEYVEWDIVNSYFKSQNCELITKWYANDGSVVSKLKLEYKCKCGRIAYTKWNNFKSGKRCGYCNPKGRVKKFSYDEVVVVFKNNNCQLLETKYTNSGTPMLFKCSCGEIDKVTLNNFKYGHRCHKCAIEKRIGIKHFAWRSDRNKLKLELKFRNKCHGYLYRTFRAINSKKDDHSRNILGYGHKELQFYITSHPNWSKVKDGKWHIDHVFPIAAFVEYNITDVKLINSLDNLQPMSQHDNNCKKDKYDKASFEKWLASKGIVIDNTK
jgi:hypothetical protein